MRYYTIAILGSILEPLTYSSSSQLSSLSIVTIPLQNREKKGVVLEEVQAPEFDTLEIITPSTQFFSPHQCTLAKFIASYYICSLGEAFGLMHPFDSAVAKEDPKQLPPSTIQLSKKQQEALQFLQNNDVSLLFGDTGSGKTEIYMEYFHKVLGEGKRTIFLMPEISLTPQMSKRLKEHFGSSFVMWHSKLTPKQKKETLHKIRSGAARVIAGARSALFLPIEDLGLIVVDEEHDDSYKSSSKPRYNARDIAIYMGKVYGVPVVLGSATPSLSSYVRFAHIRLKGGHFQAKKTYIFERSSESITPTVVSHIQETLQKKEQVIVFLPTRANFKYLICQDCGESVECPYCSVSMSLHHATNAMKCHYCNFAQKIPNECHKCGSPHLSSSRMGTVEVIKELQNFFPKASIGQFDRDSVTTATKLKKILKSFNDKEIDILVGTQMLSKGHDYHAVSLAVILGMDAMLGMSDFRAREKTLSTMLQVAGRSGRAGEAKVLIQTHHQEFFQSFLEDYQHFLEEEKYFREGLYPPAKRLCRLLFSHKNDLKAQEAMREVQQRLEGMPNIEIVGAKKCAVERVANKFRYEILLRSDKATALIKAVRATPHPLMQVDMDPIEFA